MFEAIAHYSLIFLGCVGGVTLLAGAVMGYIEAKRLSRRPVAMTSTTPEEVTPPVTASPSIITPVEASPISHGLPTGGVSLTITCDTTVSTSQDLAKLLTYARDGVPVSFCGSIKLEGAALDTVLKILAQTL